MLKRLSYILFMFYFVSVATGMVGAYVADKTDVIISMMLDVEEEEDRKAPSNFLEEDVLCHDLYNTFSSILKVKSVQVCTYKPVILDFTLSFVAPPPEQV